MRKLSESDIKAINEIIDKYTVNVGDEIDTGDYCDNSKCPLCLLYYGDGYEYCYKCPAYLIEGYVCVDQKNYDLVCISILDTDDIVTEKLKQAFDARIEDYKELLEKYS